MKNFVFKEKLKQERFAIVFGLLALLCIIYNFVLQKNIYENAEKNERMQIEYQSLKSDMDARAEIEGNYIWDVLPIAQKNFLEKTKTMRAKYILGIVVDTIECNSCLQFHKEHVQEISNKDSVIIISPLHAKFIRSDIPRSIIISLNENTTTPETFIMQKNLVILLFTSQGKILFAEIADRTNYDKSRKFYTKVKKLLQ